MFVFFIGLLSMRIIYEHVQKQNKQNQTYRPFFCHVTGNRCILIFDHRWIHFKVVCSCIQTSRYSIHNTRQSRHYTDINTLISRHNCHTITIWYYFTHNTSPTHTSSCTYKHNTSKCKYVKFKWHYKQRKEEGKGSAFGRTLTKMSKA